MTYTAPTWASSAYTYKPSTPYYDYSLKLDRNFGSNTGTSGASGGKMDPTGLIGAGIGAIGGIISGIGANRTNASIAEAQAKAQTFATQQAFNLNQMGLYGNLGSQLNSQIWGNVLAPDLDVSRQLGAKRTELAELLPKEEARQRENLRWEADFKSSPAFRNVSQQEKISDLKYNPDIIRDKAKYSGLFGEIAQAPLGSLTVA
jgi:hypothetical protein